ncbi:MAG TPA: hypothetical protein VNM15_10590 [Candidatus Binatia bacterium]|nr:hypothetical protein [Candidatus Binatia bacterium]
MGKTLSIIAVLLVICGADGHGLAAQSSKAGAPKAPQAVKEKPGPWLLAGREGECTSPAILAKKGPEYADIQSPYQLAEKLRAAGHKAEIKEFKAGSRPAVEVRSPSAGLAIMFVKKEYCDKPIPPEKK